eukprot:TRINITY_DN36508_c0_g1_i8.p1 TRINITY_DN36508_c0_g1~~TRINITY_DN36508_c0_g1_i8.p1  ORF type:complete len:951 (-),score=147.50 TRINITY_DN36508_c0_g1_i8:964-3816(-)
MSLLTAIPDPLADEWPLISNNSGRHAKPTDQESVQKRAEDTGERDVRWWLQECPDANELQVEYFGDLELQDAEIEALQSTWTMLQGNFESRQRCGEAICDAFFECAPAQKRLFTKPKAVQALRFVTSLHRIFLAVGELEAIKEAVETLAFSHICVNMTPSLVFTFRDAIMDLLSLELRNRFSAVAAVGMLRLLNYMGGAFIFMREHYADRLHVLRTSWQAVGEKDADTYAVACHISAERAPTNDGKHRLPYMDRQRNGSRRTGTKHNQRRLRMPTSFREIFMFNAELMGLGKSYWMFKVLDATASLIENMTNAGHLQEDCRFLVLKIAKTGPEWRPHLDDFHACMLASLRSVLPADWTPEHEVAWTWMWEKVKNMLNESMAKTRVWEQALAGLLRGIDEATGYQLRRDVYTLFFSLCPEGDQHFKQSKGTLHLIASKIFSTTLDIYRQPCKMVHELTQLGLRHVGYGIPIETFPPFTMALLEVLASVKPERDAWDAFRWSIDLVSKMQMRVISEGSTIVMEAIKVNSLKALQSAISCAPRGDRFIWMLMVKVGNQDTSPLFWAIEGGSQTAAAAMIQDLLTIRADREKYYYGANALFQRHYNIVHMILKDAPSLMPVLLDGLIWRSRLVVEGHRRVNYFIQHLMVGPDGQVAKTIDWLVRSKDHDIVRHPTLTVLGDTVWNGVARGAWISRKIWFLLTLLVFVACQSVISGLHDAESSQVFRTSCAVLRSFVYLCSLGQMLWSHGLRTRTAYALQDTFKLYKVVPVPRYLRKRFELVSATLMCCLLVMLVYDPMLHCLSDQSAPLFAQVCPGSENIIFFPYSIFSMLATILYFLLLVDLSVLNNRLAQYVLISRWLLPELVFCLLGVLCCVLVLSLSLTTLDYTGSDYDDVGHGMLTMVGEFLGIWGNTRFSEQDHPAWRHDFIRCSMACSCSRRCRGQAGTRRAEDEAA